MIWLARRLGISVLLMWAVASIVFLAIRIVPGDPAVLLRSRSGIAPDPVTVARVHRELGLDRSVLGQYFRNVTGLLHGDLGRSLRDDSPVAETIALRLPRTIELTVVAVLFAGLVGIPGGVLAAMRRTSLFDRVASIFGDLTLAVPSFVFGLLLVLVLSQTLGWMPAGGYVAFAEDPLRHLALLVMPSVTVGAALAATLFGMTRGGVIDVEQRDYVRTARAKGLTSLHILLAHVLRNVLLPILSVLPRHIGTLLGGTVLAEYIFNYPGVSGLLVEAVSTRDYPVVAGAVVVLCTMFIVLNLLTELLYALLDPRVRIV